MTQLKPGEMEVLLRMSQGLTDDEIAKDLNRSVDAIKSRATRLYQKLGVHNRTAAVAVGYQIGALPSSASDEVLEQNIQLRRTVQGMRKKVSELEVKHKAEVTELERQLGESKREASRLLKANMALGNGRTEWLDSTQGRL